MRRFLSYLAGIALLVCCAAACRQEGRIIPRKTLSKIYVDMLMADQWLTDHPDARRTADTTFFYEPIFRKYGYTFKDYNATVDLYIDEPDKFLKIINETTEILRQKKVAATRLKGVEDGIRAANAAIKGYETRDFSADSVAWSYSSILWPVHVDVAPVDSLQLPDSLSVADSLALGDSLALDDSLFSSEFRGADDSVEVVKELKFNEVTVKQ